MEDTTLRRPGMSLQQLWRVVIKRTHARNVDVTVPLAGQQPRTKTALVCNTLFAAVGLNLAGNFVKTGTNPYS